MYLIEAVVNYINMILMEKIRGVFRLFPWMTSYVYMPQRNNPTSFWP